MKNIIFSRLLAGLLICSMIFPLVGCGGTRESTGNVNSQEDNIQSNEPETESDDVTCGDGVPNNPKDAVTDFSVRLFKNSLKEGENTLVSPLSVIMALSMTGNGAGGNTLKQMEKSFDTHITILNGYFRDYVAKLPQGDKYKLQLANSIWFTKDESFTVNQDFLQINENNYNADIYRTAFDDTTLKDINLWVEQETDGMIKNILDEIPEDAVMYLINALAFEAEWAKPYDKSQVLDKMFTTEGGEEQPVRLMYSEESLYLEDEQATGFIKYYAEREYAFVALLPKEGVSVADYVEGLSGYQLTELLSNPQQIRVDAAIPAFETKYDALMNDVLIGMGVSDAFDADVADFSELGNSTDGNIFINRMIHKAHIMVGPLGSKAGAASVVEMVPGSADPSQKESKTVHLDRPFIYMLIECENNQPFFMGTCVSVVSECGLE